MLAAAPRFFQTRSIDLHCIPSVLSFYCSPKASKGFLKAAADQMEKVFETDRNKLHANLRLRNVDGHITEILDLRAEKPSLQVLFIPGNPGIVSFYKDYVEAVYELLDRKATVTAIGHIAHTSEDWENGRLFSLQEQISHKIEYIKEELLPQHIPILLAGHSIGAYISLEIFKAFPEKVSYMIGMYPFLTMNRDSAWQSLLTKSAMSRIVSVGVSSFAALVGLFPTWFHQGLIKRLLGRSWSSDAVHVACTYLLRYSMVRNFTFMGMTEFKKLQENLDWAFIKDQENRMTFLFGIDDHWGPLSLFEEVSQNAPAVNLEIEKEGHTHAFCCTKAGSVWVANHTVDVIRKHVLTS